MKVVSQSVNQCVKFFRLRISEYVCKYLIRFIAKLGEKNSFLYDLSLYFCFEVELHTLYVLWEVVLLWVKYFELAHCSLRHLVSEFISALVAKYVVTWLR